ncbi:MAG: glycine--tRNA ligase subunit beta [Proteobacteria bacterium]|nr:glycine--tRNA ligase subunit beta [Cystobacterineae bacterium]MCL2259054.1 glycine--tRNA ligase subunit beta [Cystobacterineae bacterium]MCL2314596.1 glycine--tRNA ligase subunit beta [Pseudomonadota bacterium]
MKTNHALLEIGFEEMPASFLLPALEALSEGFLREACEAKLLHGQVEKFATPRRLALLIGEVREASESTVTQVLGPSVKVAYDAEGKPTKAASKFAQSHHLEAEQLQRVQTPKGEYIAAEVRQEGQPVVPLLSAIFNKLTHELRFRKSMRWADTRFSFARPIHWLVGRWGKEPIPFLFADVHSGTCSYGHRFLHPGPIELPEVADYEKALLEASVVARFETRKEKMLRALRGAAKAAGGELLEDEALAEEVANLVEWPTPILGGFKDSYLDLPPEVLITEMKQHQRYFALVDEQKRLLPKFLAVSNTPVKDVSLSAKGYSRVLNARLADARFFFDEDRRKPLASRLPMLERVIWVHSLGSYAEKTERLRQLSCFLAREQGLGGRVVADLERAAELCKADLLTGMVGEFPELQGVMGREYALHSGESREVADAIFEHHLPRSAQGPLPDSDTGALLSIADKLDNLCGLFGIGKPPTGAADPFALRRACLAILNICLKKAYSFSLQKAVQTSLGLLESKWESFPGFKGKAVIEKQVLAFFENRLRVLWAESFGADLMDSVVSTGLEDLSWARERLQGLHAWMQSGELAVLVGLSKRLGNLAKQTQEAGPVDSALLREEAERVLWQACCTLEKRLEDSWRQRKLSAYLSDLSALKLPLERFFEEVLIMAPQAEIRTNRIHMLKHILAWFTRVADFSRIQIEH